MQPMIREIQAVVETFNTIPSQKRTKLTGALAVQVIRKHLQTANIPVSHRDVFIAGIPTEFDLLIPVAKAQAKYDLVYEPCDVVAALEVKFSGVYDRQVVPKLKTQFDAVTGKHPHIKCHMVIVFENEHYKHKATTADLGYPVHTLHWTTPKRDTFKATGAWESLLEDLRRSVQ